MKSLARSPYTFIDVLPVAGGIKERIEGELS
jgi:hypothetical protein